MADKRALPPGDGQESNLPDTRSEEAVNGSNPAETQSTVLQDPTRRRDTNTASLKRLRPQDLAAPEDASAEDPDNTETVNIKVIKEQKKQFRNMMTSSQTLAVNPDGTPAAEDEAPAQQAAGKQTLKIKGPAGGAAQETPMPASQSPKSTLKIKAPPGVAPAQAGGSKPGATLKIKAPSASGAAQEVDASAQTMKQTSAGRAGKTLKLRQGATQARQTGTAPTGATRASIQEPIGIGAEDDSPGIVYTILSAASLVGVAVFLWRTVASGQEMFNQLF